MQYVIAFRVSRICYDGIHYKSILSCEASSIHVKIKTPPMDQNLFGEIPALQYQQKLHLFVEDKGVIDMHPEILMVSKYLAIWHQR